MKRIVVSMCFIISMVVCCGLVAQDSTTKIEKSTENALPQANSESNTINQWSNPVERFIGVWSLERTAVDAEGKEQKVYPGTFMVVQPDAAYTIFVYTDIGAVITSQGNILIESTDEYIEVIAQHVNSSMVGISSRISYKLDSSHLHKSFWVAKDKEGGEYNREVNETWKRATMPVGEYESTEGFPI